MGVKMKYKNKEGLELNYKGDDIHKTLVKEVISQAIKIFFIVIYLLFL